MPFPFIGPTYQTQSVNVGVERLMNLYVEVTESPGEAQRTTYYGTPGLQTLNVFPDAPGRGVFAQDDRCFAVYGAGFFEVTQPVPILGGIAATFRGFVDNDAQPVS